MARVSYEVPNTLDVRKHDAPPNSVITDESPPDTSFGYATLLNRSDTNSSGNLSDILSAICFDDDQSNSKHPLPSGNGNLCLDELSLENICPENSRKHLNSSGNLSDILSAICIDDQSSSNKIPMQSNNSSLCLGELNFKNIFPETRKHLSMPSDNSNSVSSFFDDSSKSKPDKGSSYDININDLIVDASTKNSNNFSLKDNKDSGFSFFSDSENQLIFFDGSSKCKLNEGSPYDINIEDLIEDVNTKSSNFSLNDDKGSGFSFFSNSENQLTFAQMLDSKNTAPYDSTDVSMLDLYNSLQSSKEATSESNSSSSDEMEDKNTKNMDMNSDGSDQDSGICGSEGLSAFESNGSTTDDDLVMGDIDLTKCIKSFEDKLSFKPKLLVSDTDVAKPNLESSPEHLVHTSILSLPFKNILSSQAPRVNFRQSLFSKALACKSKKDPSRLLKVANIKAELSNKVFGRVVPVKENTLQIGTVAYSDKHVIQCNFRRAFGQIEVSESPIR